MTPKTDATQLARRFALGCAALVAVAGSLPADVAAGDTKEVEFVVVDATGDPAAGASAEIRQQGIANPQVYTFETNAAGAARLTLPEDSQFLLTIVAGDQTLAETSFSSKSRKPHTIEVPLYRFDVFVSATNGDLLEGARATYVDSSGRTTVINLRDGVVKGFAPAGPVDVSLTWNAQGARLVQLDVPKQRTHIAELEIVSVDAHVFQKDSSIPFGPVLIASASPGLDFGAGAWSDAQGKIALGTFAGPLRLQADWFGHKTVAEGTAPGRIDIPVALPTKTIPGPTEGGPTADYQVQLRQPNFQIWSSGTPRDGVKLPLPPGRYDVMIYDAEKKPTFRGIATIVADSGIADIEWKPAVGEADALAERKLIWPRGIWTDVPAAGVQDAAGWTAVAAADNGSLGFLPEGMPVRVPNNELGKTYLVESAEISVQLGVLEVQLAQAERIKILSAANPSMTLVHDCTEALCRIPVPPGNYLVYVPSAQLLKNPQTVTHGQSTFIHTKAL